MASLFLAVLLAPIRIGPSHPMDDTNGYDFVAFSRKPPAWSPRRHPVTCFALSDSVCGEHLCQHLAGRWIDGDAVLAGCVFCREFTLRDIVSHTPRIAFC